MSERSYINLVGNTTQGENIGTGTNLFKDKINGNTLRFRTICGSGTTSVSQSNDSIIIYSSGSTGGGEPAGNDTEIQFNSGGTFTASSQLTYDPINCSLTLGDRTGVGNYGELSATFGSSNVASGVHSAAFGSSSEACGDHSAAFGFDTTASGQTAFSLGYLSCANGCAAIAGGRSSCALDHFAMAFGYNTKATGNATVALNCCTVSSGVYTLAAGLRTCSDNYASTAFGGYTHANGPYSMSFGGYTYTCCGESTAFGNRTCAINTYATAFGHKTIASGEISLSFGECTEANDYLETTLGRYNTIGTGSQTTWNETDNLFTIGNGTDTGNTNNAFQILKNGNTTIDGKLLICNDFQMTGDTYTYDLCINHGDVGYDTTPTGGECVEYEEYNYYIGDSLSHKIGRDEVSGNNLFTINGDIFSYKQVPSQLKNLRFGVIGNSYFCGDVTISGNTNISGSTTIDNNLTLSNEIQIGPLTGSSVAGKIRWTGSDFEGYDGSSWLSLTASGGTGGSTSPGGTDGQLQYNDGGAFSGAPIVYNGTNFVADESLMYFKSDGTFSGGIGVFENFPGNSADKSFTVAASGNDLVLSHDGSTKDVILNESGSFNVKRVLEADHQIKIGGLSGTAEAGIVRWTGSDFEGYDGSSWLSLTASGGTSSTSPGGTDGQLQYNNGGSFGGTNMVWDDSTSSFLWDGVGDVSAESSKMFKISSNQGYGNDVTFMEFLGNPNGISYSNILLNYCGSSQEGYMSISEICGYCCGVNTCLKLTSSDYLSINNVMNITARSTYPSTPLEGHMIRLKNHTTDSDGLYVYNGSSWQSFATW